MLRTRKPSCGPQLFSVPRCWAEIVYGALARTFQISVQSNAAFDHQCWRPVALISTRPCQSGRHSHKPRWPLARTMSASMPRTTTLRWTTGHHKRFDPNLLEHLHTSHYQRDNPATPLAMMRGIPLIVSIIIAITALSGCATSTTESPSQTTPQPNSCIPIGRHCSTTSGSTGPQHLESMSPPAPPWWSARTWRRTTPRGSH
jgi:hypothetical protein